MPFNCFDQKPMTDWERLRLSPYQKFKKYGRFPTKFVVNVLLLVATTWFVSFTNNTVIPYQRAQNTNWQALLQPGEESDTTSIRIISHINSIDDLIDSVALGRDTYYNLRETSVDNFEYLPDDDDDPDNILTPILSVTSFKAETGVFDLSKPYDDATVTETFEISPDSLGPFQDLEGEILNDFVHALRHFSLSWSVRNFDFSGKTRICYIETVDSHYSFSLRGRITLEVFPSSRFCEEEFAVTLLDRGQAWTLGFMLNIVILTLATFSQILHFKSIRSQIKIYQRSKEKADIYHRGRYRWENLTIEDKAKFFNIWFVTASIANVCNIVGPIIWLRQLVVLEAKISFRVSTFFSGLGCMFAWILMIQYFEHSTSYYVLVLTLKRGTPRVLRFLIGVLPVFLGYAIFGVAMFSDTSTLFANLDQSAVTLYALLNGDVIHDVFDAIYNASPIISRVYLYSFIALFIYAILNIFVAIVEDSFFASKAFSLSEQDKQMKEQRTKKLESVDIASLLDGPPVPTHTPRFAPEHLQNFSDSDSDGGERKIHSNENLHTPLLVHTPPRLSDSISTPRSTQKKLLQTSIDQMQQSFNDHLKEQITKQLTSSRDILEAPVRPPHDPNFYPCEFKDCVHCSIRTSFLEASDELNAKIDQILSDVKEQTIANANSKKKTKQSKQQHMSDDIIRGSPKAIGGSGIDIKPVKRSSFSIASDRAQREKLN